MDERVRAVARACPLFGDLTVEELDALLATAETLAYPPGACVFREGEVDSDLYVITEGHVRVSQESVGGEVKTLAVLGPGSFFGEMGLIAALPRTADVYAERNVSLLRIKQRELFALLESGSPSVARLFLDIFQTVGGRLRQTNTELVSLYAAGRLMTSEPDVQRLLHGILEILVGATHARTGAVLLFNVTTNSLDGATAMGYDDDPTAWSEPCGSGIASQALEARTTAVIEDWNGDARTKDLPVTGYERVTMLLVPLVAGDQSLGVFILGDKIDDAGEYVPFRAPDQVLVEGIAGMTAAGILNARHHAELLEREKLQRRYIGE